MTDKMNLLPPQARSIIAREIVANRPIGVVVLSSLFEAVRAICPDSISDHTLEDAITEEATQAGLVVHFDHSTQADAQYADKRT